MRRGVTHGPDDMPYIGCADVPPMAEYIPAGTYQHEAGGIHVSPATARRLARDAPSFFRRNLA